MSFQQQYWLKWSFTLFQTHGLVVRASRLVQFISWFHSCLRDTTDLSRGGGEKKKKDDKATHKPFPPQLILGTEQFPALLILSHLPSFPSPIPNTQNYCLGLAET